MEAGKFFGETSKVFFTKSFRFIEKSVHQTEACPVHTHELAYFCFVLSGRLEERIGTQDFERKPQTLICYPPGMSHSGAGFSVGRVLLVEIAADALVRAKGYGMHLVDKPVILNGESNLRLATRMYKEFVDHDDFSWLALECMAAEMLIRLSRHCRTLKNNSAPKWLRKATNYLQSNYSTSPGLIEVAKIAGVHPNHLARVFRKYEGCSAGDYVRTLRFESARNQLIGTEMAVVDIALNAGFSDQSHFTRAFKRSTGVTPTEFRRLFGSAK